MMIGNLVYADVSGYHGVYVVARQIGDRLLLTKPGIANFTLLVSQDKISCNQEVVNDIDLASSFTEEISEKF